MKSGARKKKWNIKKIFPSPFITEPGIFVDITDVQGWLGTGQSAQMLHQRRRRLQVGVVGVYGFCANVVVEAETEPGVKIAHQIQVGPEAGKEN